jgi:alkylation response protein AidB-like acyl-CoA dehydrogenase
MSAMKVEVAAPPQEKESAERAKREAMDVAEAARETEWKHPSFAAELFAGRFRPGLILPFPVQEAEDRRRGDEYLARVGKFLREKVDADQIDRTGELPAEVVRGLIDLGCFGMKIPKEYGGLGLSQTNYNRTVQLISSHCGSTAVWISAHQSIGVPQPLKLFGTEEQKKKYLPRLAHGEISAFALTEPGVGSDPANMETVAVPTPDGGYLLNGEKLWCTNGTVADVIVVMARTPSVVVKGKERKQVTAFIVEKNMPGVEVVHRCEFLGIRAIQNGLLRFKDVRLSKESVIWGPGLGLKLALITLNTGRLTVPAACTGAAKRCLQIVRRWSAERKQWGGPIGKHDAVAAKLAEIAAGTFAMNAVTWLTAGLADRGGADIRLEAAMAKLFCSEMSWRIVDETLQVRGGRGYETARSLKARGEEGIPVERIFRDARINRIIEGTSEIMRLFIAREALDWHLRAAGALLDPRTPVGVKVKSGLKAASMYARWYPRQWVYWVGGKHAGLGTRLSSHFRFIERASHRLARSIFHLMAVHQAGLEKRQQLLARVVDIGVDLFAMAAACAHARTLAEARPENGSAPAGDGTGSGSPLELADFFSRKARRRIAQNFRDLWSNDDRAGYRVARTVLDGKYEWLEEGIL